MAISCAPRACKACGICGFLMPQPDLCYRSWYSACLFGPTVRRGSTRLAVHIDVQAWNGFHLFYLPPSGHLGPQFVFVGFFAALSKL